MKNILVYDEDEKALEEVAEKADVPVAEVIAVLMNFLDDLEL